jgi:hypothetical protein
MKNPIQPIAKDSNGYWRFKANAIIRYLCDEGLIDLNAIATMGFSNDDQQQLAQLLGYSLNGYGELGYVDNEAYETAHLMAEKGLSEDKARIEHLETELAFLRKALKEPMARLFEVHPDDLDPEWK